MTLATPIEPQVRFWLVQECQETICDQQDLEIWCRACEISDGTEFLTQEMLRKWIAAREGWLRENEAWIIQKNSNPLFALRYFVLLFNLWQPPQYFVFLMPLVAVFATRWGWFKVPDILRSILHAFHIVDLNFSRFFHDGFHNKPSKAIIDSIDHPMLRWRIPKTGSPSGYAKTVTLRGCERAFEVPYFCPMRWSTTFVVPWHWDDLRWLTRWLTWERPT